jgi:tetratricopeptide (TPR) repeat protein
LEKVRIPFEPFGRRSLLLVLASVVLLTTTLSTLAPARTNKKDREKIVRKVAKNYIRTGVKLYEQGKYKQAEKYFLLALDDQEYLTEAERKELSEILAKAHSASMVRKGILERIQTADALIKQDQLGKAKALLEQIKDSEFLTAKERKDIATALGRLSSMLAGEKPEGTRPEAPVLTVEDGLTGFVVGRPTDMVGVEAPNKPARIPAPPKEVTEGTHIGRVIRTRMLRRQYAQIMVSDANENVPKHISKGRFDEAKALVDRAKQVVDEYQLDLGDYLYDKHIAKLQRLSKEITLGEQEEGKRQETIRIIQITKATKELRERTETERKQRINDLMQNARELQKKQKYEEAVGQLQMLLKLDPLHDNALILKDLLEDTIYWRKEAETRKERSRQTAEMLLRTDESMIPYAEEVQYPKDWPEIVSSPFRQLDEVVGQNPADVATYRQLDEVVSLADFNPDMTLMQAIEQIRNTVTPPLKIVVLWRDLEENADIEQDTPINMGPISAAPMGTALDLLLKSVSSGLAMAELGYVVENGVITVATKDSLPSKMESWASPPSILEEEA